VIYVAMLRKLFFASAQPQLVLQPASSVSIQSTFGAAVAVLTDYKSALGMKTGQKIWWLGAESAAEMPARTVAQVKVVHAWPRAAEVASLIAVQVEVETAPARTAESESPIVVLASPC